MLPSLLWQRELLLFADHIYELFLCGIIEFTFHASLLIYFTIFFRQTLIQSSKRFLVDCLSAESFFIVKQFFVLRCLLLTHGSISLMSHHWCQALSLSRGFKLMLTTLNILYRENRSSVHQVAGNVFIDLAFI